MTQRKIMSALWQTAAMTTMMSAITSGTGIKIYLQNRKCWISRTWPHMFYLGSGRLDRIKHRNQTTGLILTFSSLVLVFQPRISSSYRRFMLIISSHIIYFNASCPQKHKYNSMLTVTVTEQMYSMCSVDRLFLLPPSGQNNPLSQVCDKFNCKQIVYVSLSGSTSLQ